MCLLFFYVAKQTHQNNGKELGKKFIKFIIAANRDEIYSRPSKPAQLWDTDKNILAGQDVESRGTWLGINKRTGRLAALTNIMGGTVQDLNNPKVSRGALISDYLNSSSTLDGNSYCLKLHENSTISEKFNKFNLLTVDFDCSPSQIQIERNSNSSADINIVADEGVTGHEDADVPTITYFSNATNNLPIHLNLKSERCHQKQAYFGGISNSVWQNPFQKVIKGCQEFEDIIQLHNNSYLDFENVYTFRQNLLHLLRSKKEHFPDQQIESQANDQYKFISRYLSSNFVAIPATQYGTRTHTIIFVDSENQVDFHEWTMTEPINIDAKQPTWMESNFRFRLFS